MPGTRSVSADSGRRSKKARFSQGLVMTIVIPASVTSRESVPA
jgi:hypothetical protein